MSETPDFCERCKHATTMHLPKGMCRHIVEELPDGKTEMCRCRDFTFKGNIYRVTEMTEPPYFYLNKR